MLLLTSQELFGKDFLSFLVHRNPELRGAISEWLKQVKAAGTTEQHRVELFLKVGPQHVLQAAQEDFIRQVRPPSSPVSSSAERGLSCCPAALSREAQREPCSCAKLRSAVINVTCSFLRFV